MFQVQNVTKGTWVTRVTLGKYMPQGQILKLTELSQNLYRSIHFDERNAMVPKLLLYFD